MGRMARRHTGMTRGRKPCRPSHRTKTMSGHTQSGVLATI